MTINELEEIYKNKYAVKELIRASGIKKSYATKLSKGLKLIKICVTKVIVLKKPMLDSASDFSNKNYTS